MGWKTIFGSRRAFGVAGFCCGGAPVVAFWACASLFVIPPRRECEPRHRETLARPADFGFSIDRFTAAGGDSGVQLEAALLTPVAEPGEAVKTRRMRQRLQAVGVKPTVPGSYRGTVVMLHGRGGIKEHAFPVAERFVAAGFRCLIYDARAHGESGGTYCTYGFRERADLRAVIDAAQLRYGRDELGPLLAFGISQGAAVVLQSLPDEPRLRAAVTVAPFAELSPVAAGAVGRVAGAWVPDWLRKWVVDGGGWLAGFPPSAIRPVAVAPAIPVPVMVVHGDRDSVIPLEHGRRIYDALGGAGKLWRPVVGGTHGAVLATGGDDLYLEMILFWIGALEASQHAP